jgi:aminopeptidase N
MKRWAVGLILAASSPALAQETEIYDSGGVLAPEQASFDVTFYGLDLEVDPGDRSIGGVVTARLTAIAPLRLIVLDLDTLLEVSSIELVEGDQGRLTDWERRIGRLWIDLGEEREAGSEIEVRISYEGRPRVAPRAPWDGGFVWTTTPSGEPWIATAVQGEGADVWWPVKDHVSDKPDSMSIRVRVPEPLVVATNGRLTGVEEHPDGTRTYDWFVSTPISAYNVALNIAPYEVLEAEHTSVSGEVFPVFLYVLPTDVDRGRHLLVEILEHLRFYEELLGPYPFRADKYGVAQTPHLGMEHQTIIAYGARFDPGAMTGGINWGFDALHHHELAHEWWGNLVTNSDWRDMWLHEGFGTYMQALYAERIGGPELYHAYLAAQRNGIANLGPLAPRESRTAGQIYFDSGSDIYSKGAWFLHTLRWVIGDEDFFGTLRRMAYPDPLLERVTDGNHTRFATTDDYLRVVEGISGMDLDWLFEIYLRQPTLPRLTSERSAASIHLSWEVPAGLDFPMPLEVDIDGERRRVVIDSSGLEIEVPANAEVTLDPDGWILRSNQRPVQLPGQTPTP